MGGYAAIVAVLLSTLLRCGNTVPVQGDSQSVANASKPIISTASVNTPAGGMVFNHVYNINVPPVLCAGGGADGQVTKTSGTVEVGEGGDGAPFLANTFVPGGGSGGCCNNNGGGAGGDLLNGETGSLVTALQESTEDLKKQLAELLKEFEQFKQSCGCVGAQGQPGVCDPTCKYGKCENGRCVCDEGFTGDDCSERACPDNCKDRGDCVNGVCVCKPGFTGADCSQRACVPDCGDRGRCVDGVCQCEPGFEGPTCTSRSCPGNCMGRGVCVDGVCQCEPAFTGPDCSSPSCPNDCFGRGVCVDGVCQCEPGYFGENCAAELTVPAPISGVFTRDITINSVFIGWVEEDYVDNYLLEYRRTNELNGWNEIEVFEPGYTVTGLASATEYQFRVSGVNAKGRGEPSDVVEVATKAVVDPGAPRGVRGLPLNPYNVRVEWRPPSNPTDDIYGYKLQYQKPGDSSPQTVNMGNPPDSTYILRGVSPDTQYNMWVTPYGPRGDGPQSQPFTVQTQGDPSGSTDMGEPGAPVGVTGNPVDPYTIQVEWQPPTYPMDDIAGYRLLYEKEGDTTRETVDMGNPPDRTYNLAGVSPDTQYNMWVMPYGPRGDGPQSRQFTVKTQREDLGSIAPKGAPGAASAVTRDASSLLVEWEAPTLPEGSPDLLGYRLFWRRVGEGEYQTVEVGPGELSYILMDLDTFTEYEMYVVAFNANGDGPNSDTFTAMTAEGVPGAPVGLTGEAVDSQSITVRWEAPETTMGVITGYKITYQPEGGVPAEALVPGSDRSHLLTGLTPYTVYTIYVVGRTSQGEGDRSDSISVRTFEGVPDAPSDFEAEAVDATSIQVSWEPPANTNGVLQGYKILYRQAGTEDVSIAEVAPAAQYHLLTELQPFTVYLLALVAFTEGGEGETSPEVTVQTDEDVPGPPQDVSVEPIDSTSSRVVWQPPAEPNGILQGYKVLYKDANAAEYTTREVEPTEMSYVISDMIPGTEYVVAVLAFTGAGDGPASEEITIQTAEGVPEVPTSVTAEGIDARSIRVSWQAPAETNGELQGYYIYYTPEGSDEEQRAQVGPTDTSYVASGLQPYTVYIITVSGFTRAGEGDRSAETRVQTLQGVPESPTGLGATPVDPQTIRVEWQPPQQPHGEIQGYNIYYRTTEAEADVLQQAGAQDIFLMLTGLRPFTEYTIRVSALTGVGEGQTSDSVTVSTPAGAPSTPMDVEANAVDSQSIRINWQPPAEPNGNILGYNIYYTTEGESSNNQQTVGPDDTTYVIEGLRPSTQYAITLTAFTEAGQGQRTEEQVVTTLTDVPGVPASIEANALDTTSIRVEWQAPSETGGTLLGYKIYYQLADDDSPSTADVEPTETSYLLTELRPYSQYLIWLVAYTEAGEGERTEQVTVQTPQGAPSTPLGVTAEGQAPDTIQVTWQPPTQTNGELLGYYIYYRLAGFPDWFQAEAGPDETTYSISGLLPATEYIITLTAYTEGGESERSGEIPVRTLSGVPSTPLGVTAQGESPNTIIVAWQTPDETNGELLGYYIYYQEVGSTETSRAEAGPNDATYIISGLRPATEYIITLTAHTEGGESERSREALVSTLSGVPGAPRDVQGHAVDPTTITVDWQPPVEINGVLLGYKVIYMPENAAEFSTVELGPAELSTMLLDLEPQTTYSIVVLAFTAAGDGDESEEILVSTLQGVPGAPTDLAAVEKTSDSMKLSWQAPEGDIEGYRVFWTLTGSDTEETVDTRSPDASWSLTGLQPFGEYSVSVLAYNSAGDGERSETITVQTEEGVPGAPREVQGIAIDSTTIELQWMPPSPDEQNGVIQGYKILYKKVGEEGENEEDAGLLDLMYTLSDLEKWTEYNIWVSAYTSAGDGLRSPVIVVRTGEDVPGPPIGIEARPGDDSASVLVQWQQPIVQNGVIVGYKILYQKSGDEDVEVADIGTPQLAFTLSGLDWDDYNVWVVAYTGAGDGDRSDPVLVRPAEGVPTVGPGNLNAEAVDAESIRVSWTRISDAEAGGALQGYQVFYQAIAADGALEISDAQVYKVEGADTLEATLTGLEAGTRYAITVSGYTSSGTGIRADLVEATTQVGTDVGPAVGPGGIPYPNPTDCGQVVANGETESGPFTVYPSDGGEPIEVWCDMETDGGGWIVFQRRQDGSVDFWRRWREYRAGFGENTGEFWLGNDNIHRLSAQGDYQLRIDLADGADAVYGQWENFKLGSESDLYKLNIGEYSGTSGDSLTYHNNRPFSTRDKDNDVALSHCAFAYHGAWWYKNCHRSNLNGQYGDNTHSQGVNWYHWKGHEKSVPFVEMKMRSMDFKTKYARAE